MEGWSGGIIPSRAQQVTESPALLVHGHITRRRATSAPRRIFENVDFQPSSRRDDSLLTPDKAARPQSGVGDGLAPDRGTGGRYGRTGRVMTRKKNIDANYANGANLLIMNLWRTAGDSADLTVCGMVRDPNVRNGGMEWRHHSVASAASDGIPCLVGSWSHYKAACDFGTAPYFREC